MNCPYHPGQAEGNPAPGCHYCDCTVTNDQVKEDIEKSQLYIDNKRKEIQAVAEVDGENGYAIKIPVGFMFRERETLNALLEYIPTSQEA